mgnify:CR=1 FL=1
MTTTPVTLIVVDDDPEIRELLADYLGRHGYRALTAEDGEALQTMRDGDSVELTIAGETFCLPIRLRPDLPKGTIGLPVGLAGQPWRDLPTVGEIRRRAAS